MLYKTRIEVVLWICHIRYIWVVIKTKKHLREIVQKETEVAHHNYGKYEDKKRDIDVLVGSDSLEKDVMRIYKEEFEQARISYNDKQTREDRKIKDYFKHISDNAKNDLACEIIIELGNKAYWDKQNDNYKRKMSEVFKQQVKDLEMLVPEFKIASAIVHYDETLAI